MKKRFFGRDVALLMVPVLAVVGLGWWFLKRPVVPVDDGKIKLKFSMVKPTTLEAFRGFEGAFVVLGSNGKRERFGFNKASPYLEMRTAQGVTTLRGNTPSCGWTGQGDYDNTLSRFPFSVSDLGPGKLTFGFDGWTELLTFGAGCVVPPSQRVGGKWRVDRGEIQKPKLAAMQVSPGVKLKEVTVYSVDPAMGLPGKTPITSNSLVLHATFVLQGQAKGPDTRLDTDFEEYHGKSPGKVVHGRVWPDRFFKPKNPASACVMDWRIHFNTVSESVKTTGRVSAGERWPLGFEIEPISFQKAKKGQKLRFKTFALGLPRS